MEGNHHWRHHSHQHVEVEPVARIAEVAQPCPFFSYGVKKDEAKKEKSKNAQPPSDQAAGTEQDMVGMIGPVRPRAQQVIKSADTNGSRGQQRRNAPSRQDQ